MREVVCDGSEVGRLTIFALFEGFIISAEWK
jgi:hypothetical protein